MFGDFRQLPPVRDTPLYDNKLTDSMASIGSLIFQNFKKVIELSVCNLQSSDIEFSNLRDRVAVCEFNDKDYQSFSERRLNIFPQSEHDKFDKAIHILPTNDAVHKETKNAQEN